MPLQRCGPRRRDRSAVRAKTKHSSSLGVSGIISVLVRHVAIISWRTTRFQDRGWKTRFVGIFVFPRSNFLSFVKYSNFILVIWLSMTRVSFRISRETIWIINFYKTLSICCEVIFAFQRRDACENTVLQMCYSET